MKPKLTLEMGMIVVPFVPVTGAPTTVLTSTMLRMFSIVVCIMLSMGCCCIRLLLRPVAPGTRTKKYRAQLDCRHA